MYIYKSDLLDAVYIKLDGYVDMEAYDMHDKPVILAKVKEIKYKHTDSIKYLKENILTTSAEALGYNYHDTNSIHINLREFKVSKVSLTFEEYTTNYVAERIRKYATERMVRILTDAGYTIKATIKRKRTTIHVEGFSTIIELLAVLRIYGL